MATKVLKKVAEQSALSATKNAYEKAFTPKSEDLKAKLAETGKEAAALVKAEEAVSKLEAAQAEKAVKASVVKREETRTRTKEDGSQVVEVRCIHCGKWLSKEESLEAEQGDYCSHLREEGWDTKALMEHRRSMTATEVPEGWIKVAAMHRYCVANGVPVSRMVKAIGGDRCLNPDECLNPRWVPLYSGNARWLDPSCMTPEGLKELLGGVAPRGSAKKGTTASAKAEIKSMEDELKAAAK